MQDGVVRAVLLDVDGTLIDSYAAYRRIWQAWSSIHALDFELVWAATHGRRPAETLLEVAPHLDARVEYGRLRALLAAEGDTFQPMPGARQILAALPAGRWGLVTSAPIDSVLRRFRVSGLPIPEVVVDGDSVTDGKPSPEGYLRAALLLGASAADCLVVEDAPAGVAAGRAAGMHVVGIAATHPYWALAEADECFATLADAAGRIVGWCAGEAEVSGPDPSGPEQQESRARPGTPSGRP